MSHQRPDMEVALAAAQAGAEVVRAAYGTEVTRHAKSGSDFVTEADLEAEHAILRVIESARPADARIGEESGGPGTSSTRQWLVDPLCGTLNFAAQTPLVAVNVALLDEDKSTVACVSADPIANEFFWADDRGAFLRRGGSDEALTPSTQSRLVDINCDGPRGLGSRWKTVAASSSPRTMRPTNAWSTSSVPTSRTSSRSTTDAAETKRRAGVSSA